MMLAILWSLAEACDGRHQTRHLSVADFAETTNRGRATLTPSCSPIAQRIRLKPADLHVVAERIVHVQAVASGLAHVLDAHGGERGLGAVAVEVGDGVADVVDDSLCLRPRPLAAGRWRSI